jgi:hypothetical protein
MIDFLPLDSYIPEPMSGCWLWIGGATSAGYGVITIQGEQVYAHRMSAHQYKGFDLNSPLHVLHKCDNPCCVNPNHLFIGTNRDNQQDRQRKGRSRNQNTNTSHCKRGHLYVGDNLIIDYRGYRSCRTCKNLKSRELDAKRRPHREIIRLN